MLAKLYNVKCLSVRWWGSFFFHFSFYPIKSGQLRFSITIFQLLIIFLSFSLIIFFTFLLHLPLNLNLLSFSNLNPDLSPALPCTFFFLFSFFFFPYNSSIIPLLSFPVPSLHSPLFPLLPPPSSPISSVLPSIFLPSALVLYFLPCP